MDQAKCRALVQSLDERRMLSEFGERAERTVGRKLAGYERMPNGTLVRTVARRADGGSVLGRSWVSPVDGAAVGECDGRV